MEDFVMDKIALLTEMIEVANDLDALGYEKQADVVDDAIKRVAQSGYDFLSPEDEDPMNLSYQHEAEKEKIRKKLEKKKREKWQEENENW